MSPDALTGQVELRTRLLASLEALNISLRPDLADVFITPCEVNARHGTGVLLRNIFARGTGIFCIRSRNFYDGDQDFGERAVCLSHASGEPSAVSSRLAEVLAEKIPRRILSVPYFPDDVFSTIALKKSFGVPLCTYVMDDQNVHIAEIPDAAMRELLALSDLRLGISRDLCEAYEKKYGFKFWVLPPVVRPDLVLDRAECPPDLGSGRGVLVGNIWSQRWLERLRVVTRESGTRIDWFANPKRDWLSFEDADLERDGIVLRGYLPEEQLSQLLRQSPYAVVTTGATDEEADRPEFARLSLPSRLPYITATANTPIILLGRADSAAGNYLEHLGVGRVCSYDPVEFVRVRDELCRPDVQLPMRRRAADVARGFSAEGLADWIWTSLARGEAADERFEALMPRRIGSVVMPAAFRAGALQDADAVVTLDEVTDKHGTGALVQRIFAQSRNIISLRSFNHYGGDHRFGDVSFCLDHRNLSRPEIFQSVATTLRSSTVKRIFCVPYARENVLTAIAVRQLFAAPMATYIMDDQNICVDKIPDALLRELLAESSLRLATHPELRDAYEKKFGLKFWLLPAVVPARLIQTEPLPWTGAAASPAGVLLGSVWSERWLAMLQQTIAGAGVVLDWYGNTEYPWLRESRDQLLQRGFRAFGVLPEDRLVERLRASAYVVVPTGTLDDRDDRRELSELSLPGRILFNLATSHTPIIVLGSARTSAARCVERFQIGEVCDYDAAAFRESVERITRPDVQRQLRQNAAAVAASFSDAGITDWVWESLARGEPSDQRFERVMPRSPGDVVVFIEPPAPEDIHREYIAMYHVLRRLGTQGFRPDFIIDVGASHGIWAYTASTVFPEARFLLIDPLLSQHDPVARNYYVTRIPRVELLEIAVSDRVGQASFNVSEDLYGSSLLNPADFRHYRTVEVPVDTLDNVVRARAVTGRGVLKLDVQCAEHLVLKGARELLDRVDAIVTEISVVRYDEEALVLLEMIQLFEGLGYRYYDEAGVWRSPVDGTLLQKEVLFLRKELCTSQTSREIAR
jgi:FkbM family methyltransferase